MNMIIPFLMAFLTQSLFCMYPNENRGGNPYFQSYYPRSQVQHFPTFHRSGRVGARQALRFPQRNNLGLSVPPVSPPSSNLGTPPPTNRFNYPSETRAQAIPNVRKEETFGQNIPEKLRSLIATNVNPLPFANPSGIKPHLGAIDYQNIQLPEELLKANKGLASSAAATTGTAATSATNRGVFQPIQGNPSHKALDYNNLLKTYQRIQQASNEQYPNNRGAISSPQPTATNIFASPTEYRSSPSNQLTSFSIPTAPPSASNSIGLSFPGDTGRSNVNWNPPTANKIVPPLNLPITPRSEGGQRSNNYATLAANNNYPSNFEAGHLANTRNDQNFGELSSNVYQPNTNFNPTLPTAPTNFASIQSNQDERSVNQPQDYLSSGLVSKSECLNKVGQLLKNEFANNKYFACVTENSALPLVCPTGYAWLDHLKACQAEKSAAYSAPPSPRSYFNANINTPPIQPQAPPTTVKSSASDVSFEDLLKSTEDLLRKLGKNKGASYRSNVPTGSLLDNRFQNNPQAPLVSNDDSYPNAFLARNEVPASGSPCLNLPSGSTVEGSYPSQYIECVNGSSLTRNCPPGTTYEKNVRVCT